ncbi:DUF3995 domain-containing protein [Bacillus infantis]|uniref:DUF3995 domain-containing protein n=1 Tax=Bacillus TaxID=1386 RepID=UPI003969E225
MGILHVFWAFGGKWGVNLVLPTKDDGQLRVLQPRMAGTLFIWLLCFFCICTFISSCRSAHHHQILHSFKMALYSWWNCVPASRY